MLDTMPHMVSLKQSGVIPEQGARKKWALSTVRFGTQTNKNPNQNNRNKILINKDFFLISGVQELGLPKENATIF